MKEREIVASDLQNSGYTQRLTGRIQRIRIGDAVSKDIRVSHRGGVHLEPLCFIGFGNRISVCCSTVMI
jgi:hypothetical protein